MLRKYIVINSIGWLVFFLCASDLCAQSYEGDWTRISMQFSVTVSSWGENCGTMPRSYSNYTPKPTDILQNGGHLFFASGAIRTDRCNSPNPALVSVLNSRSANMWSRTCETPNNISKYEKIAYVLTGIGERLMYEAESHFDWTLEEDRCVVSWVDKRVFERGDNVATTDDSPILKVHKEASFSEDEKSSGNTSLVCKPNGKIRRLILVPQKSRIEPSEKLCFQLRAVDSNGCRHSVSAKWSASQNGVARNQLMDNKGCFVAGDNAAKSEGTFQVVAQVRDRSAQAIVDVAYPDVGDLARAQLDVFNEVEGENMERGSLPQKKSPSSKHQDAPISMTTSLSGGEPIEKSSGNGMIIALLVVACCVFVGLVGVMIWLVRRSKRRASSVYMPESQHLKQTPYENAAKGNNIQIQKRCPKCGQTFNDDAKYCPRDACELIDENATHVLISMPPPKGMICPTCKRGYELEARFCPHDSTALVAYEKWRKQK